MSEEPSAPEWRDPNDGGVRVYVKKVRLIGPVEVWRFEGRSDVLVVCPDIEAQWWCDMVAPRDYVAGLGASAYVLDSFGPGWMAAAQQMREALNQAPTDKVVRLPRR